MIIPVVIPCLNRFDLMAQTYESLGDAVYPYIIDNWNDNRGVSGSWNEGMQRAKADGHRYVVITNDDVIFSPGSLKAIYEAIIDTGAVTMSPNQNDHRDHSGIQEGCDMFCFAVDIDQLVEAVGWFDQNFFPAYFEDNDIHWRMIQANVTPMLNTDAVVTHIGSATQNAGPLPVTSHQRFEKHRAYFIKKWGNSPGREIYTTPFGHPELTIRDWNRSYLLDGLSVTESNQHILEQLDSKS